MRYFGGGEAGQERCAGLHIVGHSMGAQLVLEATRLLLDSAESGGASAGHGRALATASAIAREKIVLLDPFFGRTRHSFPPLGGRCAGERASENIAKIHGWHGEDSAGGGLALETYVTSIIGEGWLGSYPRELRTLTRHRHVHLPKVSWLNITQRHCIAHHYYMCSILREKSGLDGGSKKPEGDCPHAKLS